MCRSLNHFFAGKTSDVWLDISGGIALQQLARQVTLMEQLRSGGVLVIPILLVGFVALVLTLERLIIFSRVRQNTDNLMSRVTDLGPGAISKRPCKPLRPTAAAE